MKILIKTMAVLAAFSGFAGAAEVFGAPKDVLKALPGSQTASVAPAAQPSDALSALYVMLKNTKTIYKNGKVDCVIRDVKLSGGAVAFKAYRPGHEWQAENFLVFAPGAAAKQNPELMTDCHTEKLDLSQNDWKADGLSVTVRTAYSFSICDSYHGECLELKRAAEIRADGEKVAYLRLAEYNDVTGGLLETRVFGE